MRIANYIQDSIVDGPGLRFVLFTQGCPHNCPGCYNQKTHSVVDGVEISIDDLEQIVINNPLTDGITFSGGDPFIQPGECSELAKRLKAQGLNIWAYSGWTFEEILKDPEKSKFLEQCDVLVDGPFIENKKSLTLKWRGSSNQRIIDVQKSLQEDKIVLWNNGDY